MLLRASLLVTVAAFGVELAPEPATRCAADEAMRCFCTHRDQPLSRELVAQFRDAAAEVVEATVARVDTAADGAVTAHLRVARRWKGRPAERMTVVVQNSVNTLNTCDRPLERDTTYVLFATLDGAQRLRSFACTGTVERSAADTLVAMLEQIAPPET